MKMIQAIFGVICAIFFLAIGGLQAAEMPASEIIKQSWEKFRSVTYETEVFSLKSNVAERELVRYTFYDRGKNDKVAISFTNPGDRGIKLFTQRQHKGTDKQWVKLRTFSTRQLSAGENSKLFPKTPFTYGDTRLQTGEDTDIFGYTFDGQENDRWVIKAVQKSGDDFGYDYRKIWVAKTTLAITKIEYYGKNGSLIKTQENSDIQTSNNTWRPNKIVVTTVSGDKTVITVIKRVFGDSSIEQHLDKSFLETGGGD